MSRDELKITSQMQVKEDSERAGLKFNIHKTNSWQLVPSLHGK